MLSQKKLKLAIIGCGAIFENNHLKVLNPSKYWEIVWIIDNDLAQSKRHAKKLNCNFGSSLKEIGPEVDVCLIATPNYLHASQSIDLLNRNFHVVCEKPMALNYQEAVKMKKVVDQTKKHFFIVHQMRFLQTIKYFRDYLEKTPLEKIKEVEVSYGNKFGWLSRTNFYKEPILAGGGVLIDLGVHLFDLMLSLWPNIQIDQSYINADSKKKPIMDTAVTSYGSIMKTIPLLIRTSRLAQLTNSLRIRTNTTEWELSLGGNQVSISDLEGDNVIRKKTIEVSFCDPFESFWKSVYQTINKEHGQLPPSMIDEGVEIMNILDKTWTKCEIIESQF